LLQDETLNSRLGGEATIVPDIYYHDLLLERSFGRLDNEAIYTYAYVWPLDKHDLLHTAFDVESVAAVCTRIYQFIKDLEQVQFHDDNNNKNSTTHVVCVSHADVLQIAQLYAANAPNIGEFSSYRFGNGEIRRMIMNGGVESLPAPGPLQAPQRGTGM
jgi:broad specificity phosphatase PhoE